MGATKYKIIDIFCLSPPPSPHTMTSAKEATVPTPKVKFKEKKIYVKRRRNNKSEIKGIN